MGRHIGLALSKALENGDVNELVALAEQGADVASARTWRADHALCVAVRAGNESAVRQLAAVAPTLVNALGLEDMTPLMCACEEWNEAMAHVLLECGADVHVPGVNEWTALHYSAMRGFVRGTRLILNAGADVAAVDDEGWTPLHWACYYGEEEVARMLLRAGSPISARDHEGATPLHQAAYSGHSEVVGLLVGEGAELSLVNDAQRTAVEEACHRDQATAAIVLLRNGAALGSHSLHSIPYLHRARLSKCLRAAAEEVDKMRRLRVASARACAVLSILPNTAA